MLWSLKALKGHYSCNMLIHNSTEEALRTHLYYSLYIVK